MDGGIRAEIRVDPCGSCPVVSAAGSAPCESISRCVNPGEPGRSTVEFVLDPEHVDGDRSEVVPIFDYGSERVFRRRVETTPDCPCAVVESHDCPVVDQYVRDGRVEMTFHATGLEELRELIGSLRERFDAVDVRRLLRSEGEATDHDLVFVDRNELTDRQREALELAHEGGYFEQPKRANASELAEEMGVSRSTFTGHLAAAQSKVVGSVLGQ